MVTSIGQPVPTFQTVCGLQPPIRILGNSELLPIMQQLLDCDDLRLISGAVLDTPRPEIFNMMAPYVLDCLIEEPWHIQVGEGQLSFRSLDQAQLAVCLRVFTIFGLDYQDSEGGHVIFPLGDSPPPQPGPPQHGANRPSQRGGGGV